MGVIFGALRAVRSDVQLLNLELAKSAKSTSFTRAVLCQPGITAGLLMRIAAGGGILGALARRRLLSSYSSDVASGARFIGALRIPHPAGIVIGQGVVIGDSVAIYQGVTLGANSRGEYPVIGDGATLYPACMVIGTARVGQRAKVGAGARVFENVPDDATIRG